MFKPHIWEIIHNRFKDGNDLRWNDDMTSEDWWIQGAFGDPFANDETMISAAPVRASFAGFLARLHRAYNGDLNYFNDDDEWSWYQEWVRPFHNPLSQDYIKGDLSSQRPYTEVPEDYFTNLRYYMENEAPGEWFDDGIAGLGIWGWKPFIPYDAFHSAINKKVI